VLDRGELHVANIGDQITDDNFDFFKVLASEGETIRITMECSGGFENFTTMLYRGAGAESLEFGPLYSLSNGARSREFTAATGGFYLLQVFGYADYTLLVEEVP
jgi:hypothetical protein